MNIKGKLQVWMHDDRYVEVPLKECHQWTREGCKLCPDFAAEHADISTGGIGKFNDWTLTIVRTDAGRDLLERMAADGWIETRPGRRRPRGDRADAQTVGSIPKALAGVRDRRTSLVAAQACRNGVTGAGEGAGEGAGRRPATRARSYTHASAQRKL